jgi:hypothetical protein
MVMNYLFFGIVNENIAPLPSSLFDRYLLELMQKRGDRRLSFDEAIKSLIEDHYSGKSEKNEKASLRRYE